jgi:hypothetical protein
MDGIQVLKALHFQVEHEAVQHVKCSSEGWLVFKELSPDEHLIIWYRDAPSVAGLK